MSNVLNGNPYAVLDKQVGYKEALELVNDHDELVVEPVVMYLAALFNIDTEIVARDLRRLENRQCIACGDTKTIERKQWNPLNSQWEPHAVACQECEE